MEHDGTINKVAMDLVVQYDNNCDLVGQKQPPFGP